MDAEKGGINSGLEPVVSEGNGVSLGVNSGVKQLIEDPTKVVGYLFRWNNPSLGECTTEVLKIDGNILTIKITTPEGEKTTTISSPAYKLMHDKKIS